MLGTGNRRTSELGYQKKSAHDEKLVVAGIHCEWCVLAVLVTRWWREVKMVGVRGDSWTVGIVGIDVRFIDVLEIIQTFHGSAGRYGLSVAMWSQSCTSHVQR